MKDKITGREQRNNSEPTANRQHALPSAAPFCKCEVVGWGIASKTSGQPDHFAILASACKLIKFKYRSARAPGEGRKELQRAILIRVRYGRTFRRLIEDDDSRSAAMAADLRNSGRAKSATSTWRTTTHEPHTCQNWNGPAASERVHPRRNSRRARVDGERGGNGVGGAPRHPLRPDQRQRRIVGGDGAADPRRPSP